MVLTAASLKRSSLPSYKKAPTDVCQAIRLLIRVYRIQQICYMDIGHLDMFIIVLPQFSKPRAHS